MATRHPCTLFLLLLTAGCGADDREDGTNVPTTPPAGEVSPTTEPSPTPPPSPPTPPAPTPLPPLDSWQRMTSVALLSEPDPCLDLTDDGQPDNSLPPALEVLAAGILHTSTAAINALVEEGEMSQEEADIYLAIATEVLAQVSSIEGLNTLLAAEIAGGEGWTSHYFSGGLRKAFEWDLWTSRYQVGGEVTEPVEWIGLAEGDSDPRLGCPTLGPGGMVFSLPIKVPDTMHSDAGTYDLSVAIEDVYVQVCHDPTYTHGTILGGGIDLQYLAEVLDEMITSTTSPPRTSAPSVVAQTVYDELVTVSDMTCSNGAPCLSMCATFDGLTTEVLGP